MWYTHTQIQPFDVGENKSMNLHLSPKWTAIVKKEEPNIREITNVNTNTKK